MVLRAHGFGVDTGMVGSEIHPHFVIVFLPEIAQSSIVQSLIVGGTKSNPSLGYIRYAAADAGQRRSADSNRSGWPHADRTELGLRLGPRSPVSHGSAQSHLTNFSGIVEMLGPAVDGVSMWRRSLERTTGSHDGAMAEYCLAQVERLTSKPRTLTHVEAATVPISALTAWQALFDQWSS